MKEKYNSFLIFFIMTGNYPQFFFFTHVFQLIQIREKNFSLFNFYFYPSIFFLKKILIYISTHLFEQKCSVGRRFFKIQTRNFLSIE